jgi:alpha-D-ribose 1-methylphosphonate 5-triphosphate synthase subunit PhnI
MGYVAVKGGAKAIEASIERLTYERLKQRRSLDVEDVAGGLRLLIDQVMSEGSLYDREVAALAVKQAEGSPEEAVFLLRAYRSTLPRKYYSRTIESETMRAERRISATFKDIPGGQLLGASHDYTHRILDPALLEEDHRSAGEWLDRWVDRAKGTGAVSTNGHYYLPKVLDYLRRQGLMEAVPKDDSPPKDITKEPLTFPSSRSERLQILTRGQTGAVTALGYASLRGYGPLLHPTVAELRVGHVAILVNPPQNSDAESEADAYYVGEIQITEVESVVPVTVSAGQNRSEISFELGYGVCFGRNETKAVAMSLLDQCLERPDAGYPTHDEEFVLLHIDSVEASGFISHLKLPHYVTFQSELDSARASRDGVDPGAPT